MRAISQREYGGPEVLELVEVDRPSPRPTEVLVRVLAAGVNPVDWKARAGGMRMPLPLTVGWDVSGVVEQVGGGVPARLSHEDAAGLPLAGLTGWQIIVDTAYVQPGQRVLVTAAGGGVGHLAVQIAKARGAHVIATARADKHAVLRKLGADEVIDYTEVDAPAAVADLDLVVDAIGGAGSASWFPALRPGGLLVPVTGAAATAKQAAQAGVRVASILVEPDYAGLEALAGLVDAGQLRVLVQAVFPLAEAARAHALGEQGRTLGKIVLRPW